MADENIVKLPPQNIEAEKSLLGCLLIDPQAILRVVDFLSSQDFYKNIHQKIYESMVELFERRDNIDLLSLTNRLKSKNQFEEVGGAAYLADLVNSVPTASHVMEYAKIVQEKRVLRDLISASFEIGELARQEDEEVDVLLDKAEKTVFSIAQKSLTQTFLPVKDSLEETFKRIEELSEHKGGLRGIPTGFRTLDNVLAGLQKSDLIILAARPSMGKCVSKDTEIVSPNPGDVQTIETLVKQKKNKEILSLNDDLKIGFNRISDYIYNGEKPVYLVKSFLGREIEVTINHPFLTINGWKPLQELKIGDKIAVPRIIPIFGKKDMADWQIKSLAYFIAEGGLTNTNPRFTNANKTIIKDFKDSVLMFPQVKLTLSKEKNNNITYSVASTKKKSVEEIKILSRKLKELIKKSKIMQKDLSKKSNLCRASISAFLNNHTLPLPENFVKILDALNVKTQEKQNLMVYYNKIRKQNSVAEWLDSLGLMGKLATKKFIPGIIFSVHKQKVSLFLNRLFACDGSFWQDKKGWYHISYSSSSKKLIKQVSHLLLRFGILNKVREKKIKYKEDYKISYEIEVHNSQSILKFIDEIGIYNKEEKLNIAKKKLEKTKIGWSQDTIPIEIWNKILAIKGSETWRSVYKKLGLSKEYNIHAFRRCPRRETIEKLGQIFNSQDLKDIARSDIYWDKIKSIEYLGEKPVYDLTVLHNHNFIANDFIIHNSAMAIDLARFAACQKKIPVGIFSLEMSRDQIIDRLISAEADIDLWRLRTGRLSGEGQDNDFDRIRRAMSTLSEAPIYIDDVVSSNILQMRAMARRLQADRGLGLLIIDYLQLMDARNPGFSMVQQVTENSKALKSLAKELNVPVLALSQLSRAVEQRAPQIPRLADLRESGCLTADTLITRADTGERIMMEKLVGQKDIPVFSLGQDYKIHIKKMEKIFCSGEKMVYELKTRSGNKIKASANHPFWRIDGWKRLEELKTGDFIATPKKLEINSPKNELSNDEIIILAHLLGDGCILSHQPYHYTSADWENIQIVKETAQKLFNIKPKIIKQKNWWHVYLTSPYRLTHKRYHPITDWYKKLGLKRVRSYEKKIPQKVFSSDNKKIALFLNHLWSTDGNISKKLLQGRKTSANIYYSTTSRTMAEGVKHLLLRFGIRSRVSAIKKADYRLCYCVAIQGQKHQLNFLENIGSFGNRGKIAPELIKDLKSISPNTNLDVWPKETWQFLINPIREIAGISWRDFAAGMDISYSGSSLFDSGIGVERLTRAATLFKSQTLFNIAESDIFWDEIVSIKKLGVKKVYDATVEGLHNFVANDIIVENSLEQDADVVLFIYREDRYNQNSERKNIADIIIAKHRNGPVGKIELYFDEPRVSFKNIEKGYQE